jgi:hypothetical protein
MGNLCQAYDSKGFIERIQSGVKEGKSFPQASARIVLAAVLQPLAVGKGRNQ